MGRHHRAARLPHQDAKVYAGDVQIGSETPPLVKPPIRQTVALIARGARES